MPPPKGEVTHYGTGAPPPQPSAYIVATSEPPSTEPTLPFAGEEDETQMDNDVFTEAIAALMNQTTAKPGERGSPYISSSRVMDPVDFGGAWTHRTSLRGLPPCQRRRRCSLLPYRHPVIHSHRRDATRLCATPRKSETKLHRCLPKTWAQEKCRSQYFSPLVPFVRSAEPPSSYSRYCCLHVHHLTGRTVGSTRGVQSEMSPGDTTVPE